MLRAVPGLLMVLSCATTPVEPSARATVVHRGEEPPEDAGVLKPAGMAPEEVFATSSASRLDPAQWARQFRRPADCELAAREQRSFAYFSACVEVGAYHDLTLALTHWARELGDPKDDWRVLSRLLANRGGQLATDLPQLQEKRIPLFALATSASEPEVYKNKHVAFIGRIDKVTKVRRGFELLVVEQVRGSQDVFIRSTTPRWGEHTERRVATTTAEGLDVYVRSPTVDPFVTPGKDLLIIGVFERLRPAEDGAPPAPVLSLLKVLPLQ
ncbi:MAG: hypothetical protein JNJ54_15855 [Myxococcaceae bacterium]|nr:hypothetical protein [Myxococcaceae bacterium]